MPRLVERAIGPKSDVAVLPVASVENHGVLPLGTDYLIAECVTGRLAAAVRARSIHVAPIVPFSTAVEHEGKGYTVSVKPTVFIDYLRQVIEGLASLSKSIVVAVFHGGAYNASYLAARLARREQHGLKVVLYNFWDTAAHVLASYGVRPYPIHADPVEASVLLACGYRTGIEEAELENVLEEVKRRSNELRGRLIAPWIGEDAEEEIYPLAPVKASRELGEKIVSESVEDITALITLLRE